jgi:hypothetical protein
MCMHACTTCLSACVCRSQRYLGYLSWQQLVATSLALSASTTDKTALINLKKQIRYKSLVFYIITYILNYVNHNRVLDATELLK